MSAVPSVVVNDLSRRRCAVSSKYGVTVERRARRMKEAVRTARPPSRPRGEA